MHVKEDNILQNTRNRFFGTIRKEEELDETKFDVWKTELEKELSSFWESMPGTRKR